MSHRFTRFSIGLPIGAPSLPSLLFLFCVVALLGCQAKNDSLELVILHTNDVHARFLETNRFGGTCREDQAAEGKCFGGAARRATVIATERAAAEDAGRTLLLLDGGDQFQGTLFYNKYRGSAAAMVMNALGYDAMVVGNHEFDDGPETLGRFAEALEFPLLATNIDASQEPALASRLQKTAVIERNGHRIGIVGFITEETPQLSSPGPTLEFRTIEQELEQAVAELEGQGIRTIIALSHSGYQRDRAVARTVAGIDIIVGGHTNTLLSNTLEDAGGPYPTIEKGPSGDPVAVVTAFAWGKFLGRLEATVENGRLVAWNGEPVLLDSKISKHQDTVALIAPLAEEVFEFSQEIIGSAAVDLEGREEVCRFQECNLGNMIADALLAYGRPKGVEIALQNGGGIRSSLLAGDISIGQLLEVMPFGNTASTFRLTGADLMEVLEHAVSRADDPDNDGTGRFLQIAGLRYTYSPNHAPGRRIVDVALVLADGTQEEIDQEREYSLLFNAFNRNGGDGFEVLSQRAIDPYDQGRVISDIIIDHLRNNSPVSPTTDGRIRVVQ